MVRTSDKNTPWISYEILLRPFFYNFTWRGVFPYLSINVLSKKWLDNLISTKSYDNLLYNDITESFNILLQSPLKSKKKKKCFNVGITLSHNLLGMANNGTNKVCFILKLLSKSLLHLCFCMFYIILILLINLDCW